MKRRGNGEGTIRQRTDGRWEALVSVDGRRKSFYGKTRREVADKLTVALRAKQQGIPIVAERQTVEQYLGSWLEIVRPSLRRRTWHRYEELARVHVVPALGSVTLARLAPQHLQRLYADRLEAGSSPTTVRRIHALVHRALGQAERWGHVPRNVATLVDAPRAERREMTALSEEQARAFLEAVSETRHEGLYTLAVTTGMRLGELLGLRWRDVNLDRGELQVRSTIEWDGEQAIFSEPKTKSSRRKITLTQTAIAALRRHRARQAEERLKIGPAWADLDLVFANAVGRPIDPANLRHYSFKPLLKRAGLPGIRIHDLRHTAATLLLGRGVHPKIVSEQLGHSQIAVTLDLYSHVTPTMQREAAAVLDAVLGART